MHLEIYQHLPEHINPIIFQIGFFSVRWYSVMYLIGFAVVYGLLLYRKKEILLEENQKSKIKNQNGDAKFKNYFLKIDILNLLSYLIIGLFIGARLGYVIFYDLNYFIHNPLEIIIPSGVNCQMSNVNCLNSYGISGMSYFGGLIGLIIAGLVFCKKNFRGSASLNQNGQKKPSLFDNFWQLADFVIPAVPAGYFFGRIGNFLNGELYGRVTDVPWGMYFPADPDKLLRHPSQLYEAFFEGIVLFAILWFLRNKSYRLIRRFEKNKSPVDPSCDRNPGQLGSNGDLFAIYLFGYGFFRFFIEFFRQPDAQIGLFFGWLTLGQVFSLLLIAVSIVAYLL